MLLKNKLKTLAFFICAFALAGLFALNTASASYAEDGLATEIELPSSYLEYRDLSAPRDVYYDEDVTAVIEGAEDDKTLVIYYQGLFKEIALSNASQIARIGGQLIYQQDSSFYAYSLADGTAKQLKDAEGSVITGSYFCLNESYFLVFSTNLVKIYRPTGTADELSFTNTGKTITANATANPITVNAKNDVFYFSDNRLYRQNLDNAEIRDEYGAYDTTTNSRLLADNNYLYISSANGVSRLRLSDKAREDLAKVSAEESALGDILSPVGMAFRKGNLLIADTACDKIVEYDPETASFTGWAIATTANADNRLTVSTPDVSLNGDTYAVLNGNGLTVTDGDVFTRYDLQKMNAAGAPTTVALGDRYAALIVNSKLAFIDLEADEESAEIIYYAGDGAAFTPIDIAYSCGSFYMTTYAYPYTTFYKIEESDLNTSVKALQIENLIETFTVDIDGNIYTLIDRTVSKYTEKSLISGVTFTENVEKYRLIGYDTKLISEDDFNNPEKDAGEIGSNLTVTIVYEIQLSENAQHNARLADLEIRYKDVSDGEKDRSVKNFVNNDPNPDAQTTFISCVAEYALLLRNSDYKGAASFENVLERLETIGTYVNNDYFKQEFVTLVRKAKTIYESQPQ